MTKVVAVNLSAAFLAIAAKICSPLLAAAAVIGRSALTIVIVLMVWLAPTPKISCNDGFKICKSGLPSYDAQCADRGHHSNMSIQTLGFVDAIIATVGSGLEGW